MGVPSLRGVSLTGIYWVSASAPARHWTAEYREGLSPDHSLLSVETSMRIGWAIRWAVAALPSLGCGDGDIVNGFATYGSTKLQGFVSRADGSPVAGIQLFASFGPGAFGHPVTMDAEGIYRVDAVSHTPLDLEPFTNGDVPCRLTVGAGLADTTITVHFVPSGQTPTPRILNFTVAAP
jgi:hypothetical protein